MKPLTEPRRQALPARRPHVISTSGRLGESAIAILRKARNARSGLLVIASGERKAEELVKLIRTLAPDLLVSVFPGWDCLPYDRASPSRLAMGRRIAVLMALLTSRNAVPIIVTTPAGILQRIPPREELARAELVLRPGDELSGEQIEKQLRHFGYVFDERVDEPGEVVLRGQVMDIFPAGATDPVRVEHQDGRILAMRPFHPVSQLASGTCAELRLWPASEHFVLGEQAENARTHGSEHRLPEYYSHLDTLFSLLPDAEVLLDVKSETRVAAAWAQIQDAYESRTELRPERNEGERPLSPDRLYMTEPEWHEHLASREITRIVADLERPDLAPPPLFAAGTRPFRLFADFVIRQVDQGHRVVLAAASEAERRLMIRAVEYIMEDPVAIVKSWNEIEQSEPGRVVALDAGLDEGFRDPGGDTIVIAAADVVGSRARGGVATLSQPVDLAGTELEFRIDDVVVHRDHGLGVLRGIESVETEGAVTDVVRLSYADDATIMVPATEMDRLWRYGASAGAVPLDRADGNTWEKRVATVNAEIAESAARLLQAVQVRQTAEAPKLVPPRARYERFVARFPYAETPDQISAITATLDDLASGRPMDRLVCGDVGFGKTEVALRAAAAVALAGKQVAVVAPTTVLARQHVQTFERRFAGLDIKVGHLSRLTGQAEAKAMKAGLADGSIRIVIGTHALAEKSVRFADLGLVIIDEEQRFGAALKGKLKTLAQNIHVLKLTATPIPRTLLSALVGLQDISVIATPPSQRQPIRTFVIPVDDATVRQALMRERRRGGQSFVVCARIEEIEPMARWLENLVPELETLVVHGGMPAGEADEAMVRFADGEGDVLLATNIIESGLDVPRANTMLVWRPDRFGLAQLHQLRGRVGRGRLRGVVYLLTQPDRPLGRSARKRLETLESLDRLGAGFIISARDLDQRGAGDLFGHDQAGHVKLIGVSLYQHLLAKALAQTRDEVQADDSQVEINIDVSGHIPADYVPDPEVRINLYARLARLVEAADVDSFEDEIHNRFGDPPLPVDHLIALARLRANCRLYGISRIDAGPHAIALSFGAGADSDFIDRAVTASGGALSWRNQRLIWKRSSEIADKRLADSEKILKYLAKVELR